MKLDLVMPMGGGGTRFGMAGYQTPKPLIEIYGRPFFYWAVQSIVKFVSVNSLTFVVLQEHVEQFQIDERIISYYPNSKIVAIPALLPGAVMTCLAGIERLSGNGPILFNDCDHLFICKSFYEFCNSTWDDSIDGGLLTFTSTDNRFSYVGCNEAGYVIRTVEKQPISTAAICGAYYFKNKDKFARAAEIYLKDCSYTEFFISGVYNILIQQQAKIRPFSVDRHISFGTPEEYKVAQHDSTYKLLL